jgi:hypothetical protein
LKICSDPFINKILIKHDSSKREQAGLPIFVNLILIQTSIIRRFSAAFFLLLFAFCVTPKRFLHDLLANHQDTERTASLLVTEVSASGFHCHCDNLVVMTPFTADIQPANALQLHSAQYRYADPLSTFLFRYLPHTGVRGPPVAFCS